MRFIVQGIKNYLNSRQFTLNFFVLLQREKIHMLGFWLLASVPEHDGTG
jgi:hypothetical protein